MRKENGITLISLVVTIMVMIVLSTVAIRATLNNNILNRKKKIEENFDNTIQYTDNKIKTEQEKWNGII